MTSVGKTIYWKMDHLKVAIMQRPMGGDPRPTRNHNTLSKVGNSSTRCGKESATG